jgi:nitrate reductase gamma subunit
MTGYQVFAKLLAAFFVALAYGSAAVFVVGVTWRLYLYFKTPAPLKITLTPGPETLPGVVVRLTADITLFQNLFKADKVLWAGAWIFHLSLLLVLCRHLRYFFYPVPGSVMAIQTVGLFAGYVFPLAAVFLFWRRTAQQRPLYVSGLLDYGVLILLGSIATTGLVMHYCTRAFLVDVKAFTLGLLTFQPVAPPMHALFLLHIFLVCLLLIYFPYSKLMHSGGILFSPTRNQPFDVRKRRHVNPWDYPVD